jgi:hypothetical protein
MVQVPPSDTLFVQVTGLRAHYWCPRGCHSKTLKRQRRLPGAAAQGWSPAGPPLTRAILAGRSEASPALLVLALAYDGSRLAIERSPAICWPLR